MKKVSIIIPNYNNERYLIKCLNSVAQQSFSNLEIIIVDDGSTDNSVKTIEGFINSHKEMYIKFLSQNNLNASIARNNGLSIATGDYVLFLDSDDYLDDNAIMYLVDAYSDPEVDLVVGNYRIIDSEDNIISDKTHTDSKKVLAKRADFSELSAITPVPSNKLYDLSIIKKNKISWGNVRIGQDLDFYLKYLLFCEKVVFIENFVFRYRTGIKSMSRTFDYRIFDIVEVFNDIKKLYAKNNNSHLYKKYITIQALKHYDFQLSKQVFYEKRVIRDLIVKYFVVNEKSLDYSLCKDDTCFKKIHKKFKLKCFFRMLYTSRIYRKYKLNRGNDNG